MTNKEFVEIVFDKVKEHIPNSSYKTKHGYKVILTVENENSDNIVKHYDFNKYKELFNRMVDQGLTEEQSYNGCQSIIIENIKNLLNNGVSIND